MARNSLVTAGLYGVLGVVGYQLALQQGWVQSGTFTRTVQRVVPGFQLPGSASSPPAAPANGGGNPSQGWTQMRLTDTGRVPLEFRDGRVRQSASWVAQYAAGMPVNEYHVGDTFLAPDGNAVVWQGGQTFTRADGVQYDGFHYGARTSAASGAGGQMIGGN